MTLILLLGLRSSHSQESPYIICEPGDLNVILAAPHGGNMDNEDIPNRNAGCFVNDSCIWRHDCGETDVLR